MAYELKFNVEGTDNTLYNKGTNKPLWFTGGIEEKANWYDITDPDYPFFYNIEEIQANRYRIYIQYGGNWIGWASARFYVYDLFISGINSNPDRSYTITGTTQLISIQTKRTDFQTSQGVPINYKFTLGNTIVYNYTGYTGDEFSTSQYSNLINFNEIVKPESFSRATNLHIATDYTTDVYQDSTMLIGLSFFNLNEKIVNYVPMAIRKANVWKSLNLNNGFIKIRKANVWVDKSIENLDTLGNENTGKNRIRKNGKWLQQKDFK